MSSVPSAVTRPAGVAIALAVIVLVYVPAGFGDFGRVWAAAALLVVGLILGEALAGISSGIDVPGVVPAGLLVVLSSMYLCVPETNQFPVAALLPAALFGVEVVRREQLGLEWYASAAAIVAWVGMFGSAGWQSALAGAVFSWWPILLPLLIRQLTCDRSRSAAVVSMAVGSVAAITFARTGGIAGSGAVAGFTFGVVALVSLGVAWLIVKQLRHGQVALPD